jgi:hypothetical protein
MKLKSICARLSFFSVLGILASEISVSANSKAHIHGAAEVSVSISVKEKKLNVLVDIPLDSLVGFERKPKTDSERAKLNEKLSALKEEVFKVVEQTNSNCKFKQDSQKLNFETKKDHAEATLEYSAQCEKFESVKKIETNLFKILPLLKKASGQMVTDSGAQPFELTPSQNSISVQ